MNKMTVAIIDDHPVVIEGLKRVLENDATIEHIISFTSGSDFLKHIKNNCVDIALLDIILPDGSGINFCKEIKSLSPNTFIIGLSNQAERSIILQMLQNGASGYLLKNASADEILESIINAANGEIVFSKEVKQIMARPTKNELQTIPSLTKREKEILKMLAQGKTTAVIASELNLSNLTIDTHRKNLLQKLEAKNTAELLMIAVQKKLLTGQFF